MKVLYNSLRFYNLQFFDKKIIALYKNKKQRIEKKKVLKKLPVVEKLGWDLYKFVLHRSNLVCSSWPTLNKSIKKNDFWEREKRKR